MITQYANVIFIYKRAKREHQFNIFSSIATGVTILPNIHFCIFCRILSKAVWHGEISSERLRVCMICDGLLKLRYNRIRKGPTSEKKTFLRGQCKKKHKFLRRPVIPIKNTPMQKIWSKLVIPALGSAESNLHTTPCTIFPTQISEKYSAIVQQCTTCRQDKSGTWVVFLCFCVGA